MNRRHVLAAAAAVPVALVGCAAPLGFNPLPGGVNALVSGAQKHTGLSADQTAASLGAMFGLAQNALSPADFAKLGTTMPGIADLVTRGASVGGFSPSSLTSMKSMTDTLGKRIMVAWKSKREAARALADAAAFMQDAEHVAVVTVDAKPNGDGAGPGRDICRHLARRGVEVELRNADGLGRSSEDALLEEARHIGADLIVMGGYGQSRLREFVFGGVTRALTRTSPVPLLLSH